MSATPTVLRFGQLVIGPPGSGKSTYCRAMKEFLTALGRKVVIVNLDPANEAVPYECALDVSELITLQDVMDRLHLGPNGSLIYCMEYLEKNLEWLKSRLDAFKEQHYFLFDCPGQVELYTHHCSVRNVAQQLEKWKFKLVAVHLVDSHHCVDPGKFVSILFTSLSTMVQIELPHINLLSKVDLMEQYGKLAFGLDYYTEVLDLRYLLELMSDEPFFHKYRKLNEALITLVEDYSLVSFLPLTVKEKESMASVVKAVDKAGGYMYGHADGSSMSSLVSAYYGAEYDYERTGSMKEKFFSMDTSPKN